ncbi:peroxiredoxin [Dysgonomonas hofstadii]|uniref:Peroxiredoxin n=1 Tax=Dysgonomonas hofstadii TaxID=637886 RepID=A0A840CGH2_9BACT|nr:TlpA disulfide reductase family protein [Dysgonomonas hofstadii]MBB4035087.1 peroxiredoxin [Dysgonomonas hofstadii]
MKARLFILLSGLFFVLGAVAQNIYPDQYKVKVGDMAPDFEMSLPSGEKVKLSSLRGKVVMLQFTASWCGVCRKEMPHIEKEIWQKHKDNTEFTLYGIDREEPAETVLKFAKATGVTYPIGLDPQGDIFALYAEKNAGITRNIIIDRDGKIVMLTRLFKLEEFGEMVELIDSLLEKK